MRSKLLIKVSVTQKIRIKAKLFFFPRQNEIHVVISSEDNPLLGRFPFVRTDRPDHFRRNENFTFDQSYPARSVKS